MFHGSEIMEGAYATRTNNDSRDGYSIMTIEEIMEIYNVVRDRWLRGETARIRNAKYLGKYTIGNETTGHIMKMHIWIVDFLNIEGSVGPVPGVLKVKTHCWSEEKLGNPRKAFVDGCYSVSADSYGNVTKIVPDIQR